MSNEFVEIGIEKVTDVIDGSEVERLEAKLEAIKQRVTIALEFLNTADSYRTNPHISQALTSARHELQGILLDQ